MVVTDEFGKNYNINNDDKIGQGGQGVVYRIISEPGMVLKARLPAVFSADEDSIIMQDVHIYDKYATQVRSLIALGELADLHNVALPNAVLKKPLCGYVMPLMDGLESLDKQMTKNNCISVKGTNGSLEKKLLVLRGLAKVLRELHSKGLVYSDLSPTNVFVSQDPNNHEVWLIDADNLVYSTSVKRSIGTPMYRAPEIARGDASNSFYSDMYSFAIIAFKYLTGNSPFIVDVDTTDGWDSGVDSAVDTLDVDGTYMYETKAERFGVPIDWVCTEKMQQLLLRTLGVTGKQNPETRASASEWCCALDEACDMLCYNLPIKDKSNIEGSNISYAFLGLDCYWVENGHKITFPEIYIYSVQPCTFCENDEWDSEDSDNVARRVFFGKKWLCRENNKRYKINLPIKYLLAEESGNGREEFGIVIEEDTKSKQPKLKMPLFEGRVLNGVKLCEKSKKVEANEFKLPELHSKLELLVWDKASPSTCVAQITIERVR